MKQQGQLWKFLGNIADFEGRFEIPDSKCLGNFGEDQAAMKLLGQLWEVSGNIADFHGDMKCDSRFLTTDNADGH